MARCKHDAEPKPCDDAEKAGFKNPLDYYVSKLTGLGYEVATLEQVAQPLPEDRQRVWILGTLPTAAGGLTSENWKNQVLRLNEIALPRHHRQAYFEKFGGKCSKEAVGKAEVDVHDLDASYAVAYAKAIKLAKKAGRLPKDFPKLPASARASSMFEDKLTGLTPCQLANVDVYRHIADELTFAKIGAFYVHV